MKVYSRDRKLVTTIPVGTNPHGIWASGDGSKLYVGLENADAVDVIDTKTNTKIKQIQIGQAPQALVYAVKALPSGNNGTANLETFTPVAPLNFRLTPNGTPPVAGVGGGVTLRTLEGIDELILGLKKLLPTTTYTLYLSDQKSNPVNTEGVLVFKTDDKGAVEMNAYYQIKLRLSGRFFMVIKGDKNPAGEVVLNMP